MRPVLTNIKYRADGQITAARFGNGLEENRSYDLQGRLTNQVLADGAGFIVDVRNYIYDPAGNMTARTGTPGDQHYNYDALDRLTGQDISADSKNWQYDYGPNHNRQTRTQGSVLNEAYSYQSDTNRLLEIDKLIGDSSLDVPNSRQFIYNQANRFAEYIEDGETVANYTYNALGQRTRKEFQTETTLFHYDTGIQLLAESDETGQPGKEHLWLGARPIAQIESTGLITYLHTDHLRTPRFGTNDSQNIVWQWEGEAFGDVGPSGTIEVNLRFPGQYFDRETSQHYNYFRNYTPRLGRYLQSDPIGVEFETNSFNYAELRPQNLIDPLGLMPPSFNGPNVDFGFLSFCRITGTCRNGEEIPQPQVIANAIEQLECYKCEAECVVENLLGIDTAILTGVDRIAKREAKRTAKMAAQAAAHFISRANIAVTTFQVGVTINCIGRCTR